MSPDKAQLWINQSFSVKKKKNVMGKSGVTADTHEEYEE